MCRLKKILFLLVVYHHTQESPVLGQSFSRPGLFGGDLRKFLRIPDIKFHLPQRIISDIKEIHTLDKLGDFISVFNNKVPKSNIDTREKVTSTTFLPQIIKKHGEFEELKADCSALTDLSCEEQKELIKRVFSDFKTDMKFNTALVVAQRAQFPDDSETTTSDYESTTLDNYDLSERFHDPSLVASLVGR